MSDYREKQTAKDFTPLILVLTALLVAGTAISSIAQDQPGMTEKLVWRAPTRSLPGSEGRLPQTLAAGSHLTPVGIAVDGSGNTYVTGRAPGANNVSEFATIQYDKNGAQRWVKRYSGPKGKNSTPAGIGVDSSGNVYVTGGTLIDSATDNYDIATLKYARNGKLLWEKRYSGAAKGADWPAGIAVDPTGNAHVSGDSQITESRFDFTTIKYDKNGKQQWLKQYSGKKMDNRPTGIALDGGGNVFVTGNSQTSENNLDFTTIKYNKSGDQIWVNRYSGPTAGLNTTTGIAVDSSGDCYICGSVRKSDQKTDWTTIKYSANGKQTWVSSYSGSYLHHPSAIAADNSGRAYVAGSIAKDFLALIGTLAYQRNGKLSWKYTYGSSGGITNNAASIAVDRSGNVFVLGTAEGASSADIVLIKLSPEGKVLWKKSFDGKFKGEDWAEALALDSKGNAYVTGEAQTGANNESGFVTIKYSSSGKQQWVKYYTGG